jgi:predicted hydrocarbon binding protein
MAKPTTPSIGDSQQRVPKTAFISEIAPGRHLAEFSVELANSPGALTEASEILSRHKVNVLNGFHDAKRWSFFADLTESDVTAHQIIEQLKTLSVVTNVLVADDPHGIMVDCLHYPIMWGKYRAVLMRADTLSSMLNRIKRMFGANGTVGKVILFAMGEAAGREAFAFVSEQVGATAARKELTNVTRLYSANGWGIVKCTDVDFEQGRALLQLNDSFECSRPVDGNVSSPQSDFVRGHFAGLFSELFGNRVEVVETQCIAMGASSCTFTVATKTQ